MSSELSIKEVVDNLDTDLETGLSEEEAKKRLKSYGKNELIQKEETIYEKIIKRFLGPIPFMIELAAILSVIAEKWEDFIKGIIKKLS